MRDDNRSADQIIVFASHRDLVHEFAVRGIDHGNHALWFMHQTRPSGW